jgi:hypothetical protein
MGNITTKVYKMSSITLRLHYVIERKGDRAVGRKLETRTRRTKVRDGGAWKEN